MEDKLNIWDSISYGFDRITTRGGAILLTVYVLIQLGTQVSIQSLFMGLLSESAANEQLTQTYPLALDLPTAITGGLGALLMVVGLVFSIVLTRAIYSDINNVPTADHTRNLLRTAVVLFFVGIIYVVAVFVGFIFLFFPGIFLAVSLAFVNIAVVIEDAGVIEAFERSWELTSGNRIRLFFLGLIIVVLGSVIGGVFSIIGIFAPVVGGLVSSITTAVISLFSLAVLVGAYRQLAGDSEQPASASW